MAELPAYDTDAAICRLLAGGSLPTAVIAARLAMPERTARHRVHQLRCSGTVITGTDGLHRLAAALPPPYAAEGVDLAAAGDGPAVAPMAGAPRAVTTGGKDTEVMNQGRTSMLPGGLWAVLAVLAVAAIRLAAVVIRQGPPGPPPSPVVVPGDWPASWW